MSPRVLPRAAVVALLVAGCAPAGEPGSDAGGEPGSAFALELGTGRETFQPLDDGDTIYLERGFQGAQHVLASVRLPTLPEGRYLSDFRLVRDDGRLLSSPSRVSLPYASSANGALLTGNRVVVPNDNVDDAVGERATLAVVVEDSDGGEAGDERAVVVEWAPEGWDPDAS